MPAPAITGKIVSSLKNYINAIEERTSNLRFSQNIPAQGSGKRSGLILVYNAIRRQPGTLMHSGYLAANESYWNIGQEVGEMEVNGLFPPTAAVSRADRSRLNGHAPAVLWFTGLPASGKSTLAVAVEQVLHHDYRAAA